jgi:hypothetical protein
MTSAECPRESDVLDAVDSARWPGRVSGELAAHVTRCQACRDVAAVAQALRADHDAAWHEADVPPSGQVWWRAELRARQEAAREASRPITVTQGVAAALALGASLALGAFAWPRIVAAVPQVFSTVFVPLSTLLVPLALAVGALVVITPIAVYLVLSDE